jgi:hypothetical protein
VAAADAVVVAVEVVADEEDAVDEAAAEGVAEEEEDAEAGAKLSALRLVLSLLFPPVPVILTSDMCFFSTFSFELERILPPPATRNAHTQQQKRFETEFQHSFRISLPETGNEIIRPRQPFFTSK